MARPASTSAMLARQSGRGRLYSARAPLAAGAAFRAEELVELALDPSELVRVVGRGLLAGDVRPGGRIFAIEPQPPLRFRLAVGDDRLDRTFGLAHAAIDA